MSETRVLQVTLPLDTVRMIEAKVASGEYDSVDEVIRDSLETPVGNSPEIERWLREEVVPTYEAMNRDPSRGIPIKEAKRRIDAFIAGYQEASDRR